MSHSSSGGGANTAVQTTNPVWDFWYVLPKYEVNTDYKHRARLTYRERCSRDQVLREYDAWKKELK
jgi:hypothetical protein